MGDRDIYINIFLDVINFFTIFGLQMVSFTCGQTTRSGLKHDDNIFGK